MVGIDGLEPSTSRLSGARSNHLSYTPRIISELYFTTNSKTIQLDKFVNEIPAKKTSESLVARSH